MTSRALLSLSFSFSLSLNLDICTSSSTQTKCCAAILPIPNCQNVKQERPKHHFLLEPCFDMCKPRGFESHSWRRQRRGPATTTSQKRCQWGDDNGDQPTKRDGTKQRQQQLKLNKQTNKQNKQTKQTTSRTRAYKARSQASSKRRSITACAKCL